jgi:hypothetical protein
VCPCEVIPLLLDKFWDSNSAAYYAVVQVTGKKSKKEKKKKRKKRKKKTLAPLRLSATANRLQVVGAHAISLLWYIICRI